MTQIYKFFTLLVCSLLLFVPFSNKAEKAINIGIIDYPPHLDFSQNKTKTAPLVKFINRAFSQKGFTIEFVKLPGERANKLLQSGDIDLLLPIDKYEKTNTYLSIPVFHATPGLCFKKENFIPILSATHRLKGLTIGVPAGTKPLEIIEKSGGLLIPIKGNDATQRGIELTQRGRIKAVYHPSPQKVYHSKNPSYKELACSYFHGYSTPLYIGVSNKLDKVLLNEIDKVYVDAMKVESYEYFFAKRAGL